jgi:anti-sigma regulatory factor (Ser/Thr protein kinase)
MKELSLHILDIVQNSVQAGATEVIIDVTESTCTNSYVIRIEDNGKGMNEEELAMVHDPFYTTKSKKTGLGIPLLRQHAERANGSLNIYSRKGLGTIVKAAFQLNHLDRQPMGQISKTLISLIRAYPGISFEYNHSVNARDFRFSTAEIKEELGKIPINSAEVLNFLEEMIRDNLQLMEAT